jgi:diguanylate cyclase (GGDEF)-like protein
MKAILIVESAIDKRVHACIASLFESIQVLKSTQDVIPWIFMDPPDIIIIDGASLLATKAKAVGELRSNTIFGNLPIVALFRKDELEATSWQDMAIDDYLFVDDSDLALQRRLEFIAKRSVRELDKNPLTRLPGNESIIRHIQAMIDKEDEVALAWVDIDNFKPFNDRYGFSRGDEVLLATARIISNTAREISKDRIFVGHIGGDDFVFISPETCVKNLCGEIIHRFDMVVRNFYNDEDLDQGGIISKSRGEKILKFPIMTISIAVVLNEKGRYTHYGQASQDATDIKKHIKDLEGSNYMIDRRGTKKEE